MRTLGPYGRVAWRVVFGECHTADDSLTHLLNAVDIREADSKERACLWGIGFFIGEL